MDQLNARAEQVPVMFTVGEAAALLRCQVTWIHAQRAAGTISHHRRGMHRGTYFTVEDLWAIIASHARAARGCPAPPEEVVEPGAVPRVYTRDEAAAALGMPECTLRDQVTAGLVPHHRRGRSKGVYFTDADLAAIRAAQFRPARTPADAREPAGAAAQGATPPAPAGPAIPAEFAALRASR